MEIRLLRLSRSRRRPEAVAVGQLSSTRTSSTRTTSPDLGLRHHLRYQLRPRSRIHTDINRATPLRRPNTIALPRRQPALGTLPTGSVSKYWPLPTAEPRG